MQHDELCAETRGRVERDPRVPPGVVPLALVLGGELEDVGGGAVEAHREGAEIVEGGYFDHPGVHGIDDPGQKTDADAVAEFGVIKTEAANFLEHRAAVDVALGVPATGE